MINLLIFDLDGTLVDSAPDIVTSANLLLREIGREPLPSETIVAAIGHGIGKLVFQLIPEAKDNPEYLKHLSEKFFAIYEKNLVVRTTVMPGIAEFLSEHLGDRKLAIATNKHETLARRIVEQTILSRFPWTAIIGGNTVARPKPDPLPLLEAVSIAGVRREEAVIIGDGIPDIVAAKNAGIHSIALEFGYTDPAVLRTEGASVMLASFASLPNAIAKIETLPPREVTITS